MSVEKVAKKYLFGIATAYMCYLTHGVQALIFSQNQVNFYTQWGITDATAGAAAVSTAIMWVGIGKFVSVWIGGEISDRIGRKIPAVLGGVLYVISFAIMLITTDPTIACAAGFLSGLATSGFWDGAFYPTVQEATPRYASSAVIGIKAVISVSGIIYPLFVAMNSGSSWQINIWIPIVMSLVCVVMAVFTPFIYDDKRKIKVDSSKDGAQVTNEAQAEIQAAKDAMLKKPNALTNFITLFYGFLCMFIMYGAQQYTKAFGMTNAGLDEVAAAGLTSVYTIGSIIAVVFWAFMMGKVRWNPIKVLLIDSIFTAVALAIVLLIQQTFVIYIAIALLGFFAAGGALQTGVSVRQNVVPGPKGRNVGMYYTFMGAASVFLPFIVGSMTTSVGEASAVYIMMALLLAAACLAIVMMIYLISQYKGMFGYSALEKLPD